MSSVLRRRLWSFLLLLVVPSTAAACCCGPVESRADRRLELERARERWRAQDVGDYTFSLQRSCECTPESTRLVRVRVVGGQPVAHSYVDDGQPATASVFAGFDTAEKLYTIIEDALDGNAARVHASYDVVNGFPTGISIDYDTRTIDDEVSYRMLGLTVP